MAATNPSKRAKLSMTAKDISIPTPFTDNTRGASSEQHHRKRELVKLYWAIQQAVVSFQDADGRSTWHLCLQKHFNEFVPPQVGNAVSNAMRVFRNTMIHGDDDIPYSLSQLESEWVKEWLKFDAMLQKSTTKEDSKIFVQRFSVRSHFGPAIKGVLDELNPGCLLSELEELFVVISRENILKRWMPQNTFLEDSECVKISSDDLLTQDQFDRAGAALNKALYKALGKTVSWVDLREVIGELNLWEHDLLLRPFPELENFIKRALWEHRLLHKIPGFKQDGEPSPVEVVSVKVTKWKKVGSDHLPQFTVLRNDSKVYVFEPFTEELPSINDKWGKGFKALKKRGRDEMVESLHNHFGKELLKCRRFNRSSDLLKVFSESSKIHNQVTTVAESCNLLREWKKELAPENWKTIYGLLTNSLHDAVQKGEECNARRLALRHFELFSSS